MEETKNLTLEELEQTKLNLEKENEYLKMRKMDIALYQKAFEKYVAHEYGKARLTYDKLYNHPEYYTKWRNTFFDSQIKLIESGLQVRHPSQELGISLADRRKQNTKTRSFLTPSAESNKQNFINNDSFTTVTEVSSSYVYSPHYYELELNGICKFSELLFDENNPSKKPTYLNVDTPTAIIGYCDSVKATNNKFQLHLVDPYGECLFPPFDITPEEAELALGRICIVNCAYNHYAKEPKLMELQILPFTLTEKLGEYETDTVVVERNPKINYQPLTYM